LYGVSLPQGFGNNKVWFLLSLLCGFILYSVIVVIIFVYLFRFLTSGIRALSLGRHCGQIFFIFADFFSEKKKEGREILEVFGIFI
jgi:hypothetical protein